MIARLAREVTASLLSFRRGKRGEEERRERRGEKKGKRGAFSLDFQGMVFGILN